MVEHPKLRSAPIKEAVFEIRFSPTKDYGLFVAEMFSSLKNDFPEGETLAPFDIPEFSEGPKILRHRFSRQDKTSLFQIGSGILSINCLSYDNFSSFLSSIKKVLSILIKLENEVVVQRLGLRYLNRIKQEGEFSDILSLNVIMPDNIENKLEAIGLKMIINQNSFGKMQLRIANPIKDGQALSEIAIDLDLFIKMNKTLSEKEIVSWVDSAHDRIYKLFVSCFKAEYFKSLK